MDERCISCEYLIKDPTNTNTACIKYVCSNKLGLSEECPVSPTADFCSRYKRKALPEFAIGDEVDCGRSVRGVVVRLPYWLGDGDDREPFVVVWYGSHMSSVCAYEVELTGAKYPEIATIIDNLNRD